MKDLLKCPSQNIYYSEAVSYYYGDYNILNHLRCTVYNC